MPKAFSYVKCRPFLKFFMSVSSVGCSLVLLGSRSVGLFKERFSVANK